MTKFLRRGFRLLSKLAAAAHHYGWPGAVRVMLLSRTGADDSTTSVMFRPLQREFFYRRRSDSGTLIELAQGGYRIVDEGSPQQVRWILDGGANIGDSTLRFRRCHPNATILAVEAEQSNHALLQRTFAGDSKTIPLQLALWSEPGELRVVSTWANVAFRVSADPAASTASVRAVSVPQLMAEHGVDELDILKLDIEGAESVIFQTPDLSWVQRVRCLIFECCDQDDPGTTTRIFRALEKAGAEFDWHISGECLVLLRKGIDWVLI